jgi:hypothetical protein
MLLSSQAFAGFPSMECRSPDGALAYGIEPISDVVALASYWPAGGLEGWDVLLAYCDRHEALIIRATIGIEPDPKDLLRVAAAGENRATLRSLVKTLGLQGITAEVIDFPADECLCVNF